jgi:UDP-glucose 4-epimerase
MTNHDEKADVTTEFTPRPMAGSIAGKTVLVTGSDGFIGST